ncbi:AAA family ATPase [Methanoculleus sp. 10]|uniref:AAA family ATPase n=1 Tax=Methanoculleus sp. 10 TaxID=430615 RepID=UPI0025E3E422|nr:AAA family ATPase [Methanoculleus sp. 10]
MIVEEITIRNWRSYREPHTFRFDEGFNLLVGRNEAGKSTLFEAFTRVLFDRHTSAAEKIRQIQPLESSLAPEATIIFRVNGDRYRVRKRFLQDPAAEFSVCRGNRWELKHEGDAADGAVREILRGEIPGRASQPEHRGLCQALWYLQGDAPLPEKAWAEGVKEGLSGFVSLVARSPEEDRILQRIEEGYKISYTPTGKVKSGSLPDLFQKKIPELERELQALHGRARGVEDLRLELEDLAEQQRLKAEALKAARTEVAALQHKLEEGAALEEEKRQKEEIVRQAEANKKKVASDRGAIDNRIRKIEEGNKTLAEKQREADDLQAEVRMEQRAAEKHHETWKETHEPVLRQVETELATLQAIERTRRLEEQAKSVREQIESIQAAETELQHQEHELSATPLPTKKDLETYREQKLQLATLRGQIEQAAIRIGFDLQVENASITADPEAEHLTEDGEYLVLGPTTFAIGDLGTIHVRGGGSSLEDLQAKAQSLTAAFASVFERFGVTEEQELYDLQQRRQDLEREIKQLKKALRDLTPEEGLEQLKADVVRIQQMITNEKSKNNVAPPEWQHLSDDVIREMSEGRTATKKELTKAIEHEQQKEAEARTAHDEALQKAQVASNRLVELRTQVRGLEHQNADVLKSYGTYEHLQETLANETAAFEQAREDLAVILAEYKIRVEEPRAQYEDALGIIRDLEEQMQSVREKIIDRKARIEAAVAEDFYSRIGDLEASLIVAKRSLDQVTRQAEAVKLLRDMVQVFKKEQTTALSGPVADQVNRWLVQLTDGSYDSVRMDENIFPVGVSNPQYNDALPLDCLSYGTREQVIVLLRLAMGALLSKDERNLVVIDDRLVNADPVRMRRLCQILEEVAANHCQVVVATCNDTPYAGVRGKAIPVPGTGRME